MTATQDDTVAKLQRTIVELRKELGERDAALAQRNIEYDERIEYQAATIEVLKAMSASPGDPQPVFDLVVEWARDLCDAYGATVYEFDGALIHYRAATGVSDDPTVRAAIKSMFPMLPTRDWAAGRAILDRQIIRIDDIQSEPGLNSAIRGGAAKSALLIPLMRGDTVLGALALGSRERGGFSDSQVALLQTFAEQAVIAITSAETYRALQERTAALAARNSEYGERIEQQAATIDVLKVMSSSPGNAQPVFQLIVERALAFCGADQTNLALLDGEMLHLEATSGASASYPTQFPRPVDATSTFGRAIIARDVVQMPDALVDPDHFRTTLQAGATVRAVVAVPLLRRGAPVGAIAMGRNIPGEFSVTQMELLKTFAEQAVIAITSAETYRALQTRTSDLQETLEYQTATSDVLKVISRSTFDLQPVLDTLVQTAARLCDADQAIINRREGNTLHLAANFGFPPEYEAHFRSRGPVSFEGHSVSARAARERRPVHIHDVTTIPGYPEVPIRLGRQRTSLGVPLLRESEVIGTIVLARQRVEPFTDRQIELVSTFADQAVIAIENTRLITEQQEALEQQTATAEVLQVINASPGDLRPVFDTMLEKAMRLCGGTIGGIFTFDGDRSVTAAMRGVTTAFAQYNDKYPTDKIQPGGLPARIVETRRPVQYADLTASEPYRAGRPYARALVELGGIRATLAVPFLKDGVAVGMVAIYRQEVGAFSDKQVALLQNFAAQAVIAMENARLLTEQQEALEQQTATAEVLQVINANPGNLTPVFDAILEKAHSLCGAVIGSLLVYDGEHFRAIAGHGHPERVAAFLATPFRPNAFLQRLVDGEPIVHVADFAAAVVDPKHGLTRGIIENTQVRTSLWVPLRKDGTLLGCISAFREEVRVFSDKEIALLENFAAQALIAIDNARLLTEQHEALDRQTATAEVLQVINSSPGNLMPVFDAILEKAHRLCGADVGALGFYDGAMFRSVAMHGFPEAHAARARQPWLPTPHQDPLVRGERMVHVADLKAEGPEWDNDITRSANAGTAIRTGLWLPLRKDGVLQGYISSFRNSVRPFSDNEISLLENFAEQAVIAIENARLLNEIQQRQEELRITFENMGDGVSMFDETQHLVAWNRKFQEIFNVPDALLEEHRTYAEYVRYLGTRGDFGPTVDVEEQIRRFTETAGEYHSYERVRPDGRVLEIRHNPVPGGGFVLIYADITERKRNEAEIRAARDAAEEASRTIEAAYRDLKAAQANLIQAEKMASLGQLTAGIAHEIKNPLNFVNNFAALSVDLLSELKEIAAPGFAALTDDQRADIDDVSAMLTSNLEKITEHGKRADGIVKAMLEHSRGSSGERRMVDLNALIDEALNLAYHGARAQDQSFNITLEKDFGQGIAPIEVNPQDITRVFLNIFANGFYAATKRARNGEDAWFEPTLKVTTRNTGDAVEIRARDNGTGIQADIRDKLFQPFFTTKPTGEGTGLGLSITYDIVTKAHGGSIAVDSKVGDYSEFTIRLPRNQ